MKLIAFLALTITLLSTLGVQDAADKGAGLDPNGSNFSSDIGCGIDPNGCNG